VIVVSAVLAAIACAVLLRDLPDRRLAQVLPVHAVTPSARARSQAVVWAAVAVAGVGAIALLGPMMGALVAVTAALVLPKMISGLATRTDAERERILRRQAEGVADLLAATLASGAPMTVALACVQQASPEPMRSALRPVVAAMGLGADPVAAWSSASGIEALAPLAEATARSARSGAPLARLLISLADDLRRDHQREVEVAARSAGIRAVGPLAACFLPAFLLLGVVPVVASLAGSLLG
jgi:Flp pilus assembly protein TadB